MSETKSLAPIVKRKDCRACGGILEDLFSLGEQEVINLGDKTPLKAPLDLVKCASCHLVQLRHTVDRERLFRHYYFRSSANMKGHLKGVVDDVMGRIKLKPGDVVVDIGSNDGTLLDFYPKNLRRLGFEPGSETVPGGSYDENHDVYLDFFSAAGYEEERYLTGGRRAKVVTALFMFYDLDDPNAFLRDVKKVLATNGLFIIEMNYLPAMLASNGVDNICHEHLAYYSLLSLYPLLKKNGLYIDGVSFNDANGGSVRVYVKRSEDVGNPFALSDSVVDAVKTERRLKLDAKRPYLDFKKRVRKVADSLALFDGPNVDVLGASTRGATLLQYANVRGRQAVEKNPDKVGKTYLGMKIVGDEEFRKNPPDYAYVTAHYFKPQIIERYWDYLLGGGRLIFPLPEPVVVEAKKI